jgi:hypothetical protein
MFKLIGELVVVYLLYLLIFNVIIPIYKASKQMKGTFNDIQQKMKEQQHSQQPSMPKEPVKKSANNSGGDYIDYEEVKG